MPENGTSKISETLNGTTIATKTPSTDADRYRPKASTQKVHDEVIRSLASVVSTGAHCAWEFVSMVEVYDRDATTAIKLGHLVDAGECLEIALTHLGQLTAAMTYRLRIEDTHNIGEHTGEQNTGESPF